MDLNVTITRKALGRAAHLGYLYDARKDQFTSISLFNRTLPPQEISSIDISNSVIKYEFSDTFEAKCSNLDVQAELKASVLAGLLKLGGSGKYLSNEKESYRSVKGTLIYEVKTIEENINVSNKSLKPYLSHEALAMQDATHVVVGIRWGANVMASFEFANREGQVKKDIEGVLEAEMRKIGLSISGKGSVQFNEGENNFKSSLSIKFFGDVISQNEELPQTFEKTLELMKKVPSYLKASNKGKGVPLEYTLYPLKNVEKFFKLEAKFDRIFNELNVETITRLEQEFDQFLVAKQKFNDFYNEVNENSDFITDAILQDIEKKKNEIKVTESTFRQRVANTILQVRSGQAQPIAIEKILEEFCQTSGFTSDITSFIQQYSKLQNRLKEMTLYKEKNIVYLGKKDSPDGITIQHNNKDVYFLYISEELKTAQNQIYQDNYEYFLNLVRLDKKQSKFYIVDYDIHPEVKIKREIKIHYYRNGKRIADDLYQTNKDSLQWCIAKSASIQSRLKKPVTAAKINIPCPGMKLNCPRDRKNWHCAKCRQLIEYGFDDKFYCECGGAPFESYAFKCNSPLHPDNPLTWSKDDIERYFPTKEAEKEVNILLLGETGVGKSTFINALLNYLTYSSLEDAEKEELLVGIFTQFTVADDHYMEHTIKIGVVDNESTTVGQSATQYPKAHVFHIDDLTVRIIDTPGIGDTRGIEKDKENLQNTLAYISHYGHLNGICILLKPNNAKLNLEFRYCIKELLTNLHKKSTDNIVFCFTNCRGTFYKPGDTLPALRALLADLKTQSSVSVPLESNMFCFDSESFRFLAALKHGIQFSEDDKNEFSKSWSRSVQTTARMMEYILKCPIHNVKETLTLNESRKLIMELCKPLAQISQNIQSNIKLAEDRKKELQQKKLTINQLKDKLTIPQYDLEPISLDHPRTVCTNTKCVEYVTFNNVVKTNYIKHCHPHCYLTDVPTGAINTAALQRCDAMVNGVCRVCGCSWTEHMHITYENKAVRKDVIDQNVQTMMSAKKSSYEVTAELVRQCDQLIEELKTEQNLIIKISAQLASFTRKNAIAVFNDDLERYIEHLIKEEEGKGLVGANNSTVITGLIDMKNRYKEQQKIFDKALKNNTGHGDIDLDDIPGLLDQLYLLKHNGEQLRNIVKASKDGKTQVFKFNEKNHHVNVKKTNKKDNMIVTGMKRLRNYMGY